MAIITSSRVSPSDPSARFDRVDRPDRARSASLAVAASLVLLGSLIAAAFLVQDLLERGLLFMSA